MRKSAFLYAASLLLLAGSPAYASHQGHSGSPGGGAGVYQGSPGGASHGSHQGGPGGAAFGHGSNAQWHDFQHHEAPVRIYPHRFQGSVFPTPRDWHGDIHNFDHDHWHGGEWRHVNHNGRWGWWWVVGPAWYSYDQPVYPYPDSYTPPGEIPGWWYWCDAYQEYYPYVTVCPSGWQRVLPRD